MQLTKLLAENIKEVYEGSNWTDVSIAETISNVRWQQAQLHTQASPNTIASLVHHIYYWNGILKQRLNGNDPSVPDTNGYDVSELKNENDWNELVENTYQSFLKLADAVKDFPEEKLSETYAAGKASYYKNFQGIIEHAYYHLGQIVIIKKLLLAQEKL